MLIVKRCPGCARPHRSVCPACRVRVRPAPVGVDALFEYEGVGRAVMLAAKNRHRRDLLVGLGRNLAPLVPVGATEVTWVPASRGGRRRRGLDQAEVLARALGAATGLPVRRRLRRLERRSRRSLDRAARLDGVAMRASGAGEWVVLVDDVRTTGATLRSAESALRSAGAGRVTAVTACCVP